MNTRSHLSKVDHRRIPYRRSEIRAFACVRDEVLRLPFVLDYHRKIGVERFFIIDNGSTDGTRELLLDQPDCHVFHCTGRFFAENVDPPLWSNALRNAFGAGHWCLSLDADEMFVYPHCESLKLPELCRYLELEGADAMVALVVDMYGAEAILQSAYEPGSSFLDACPYFDPDLGEEVEVDGCPPVLMFSRFRRRAFGSERGHRERPPCITQVPLVRWEKGTEYRVAQHTLNRGKLSDLQAGVLHFKFLPGFFSSIVSSLRTNEGVAEKGLQERQNYIRTLERDPNLTLLQANSVRYQNSEQLVQLGWLRTSLPYEAYAESLRTE